MLPTISQIVKKKPDELSVKKNPSNIKLDYSRFFGTFYSLNSTKLQTVHATHHTVLCLSHTEVKLNISHSIEIDRRLALAASVES